jgi:hypothetical protein
MPTGMLSYIGIALAATGATTSPWQPITSVGTARRAKLVVS